MMKNKADQPELLFDLKEILNTRELKTYEKMIMVVIKVYQAEFGNVFPDYDSIAAAGGMCKRKAQYVVKDLEKRNLIQIHQRFKEKPDGKHIQTSNQYILVDSKEVHDVHISEVSTHAHHAPYKEGFALQDSFSSYPSTSLQSLKIDDDELPSPYKIPQKYACYAQVYKKMMVQQGTGVLCVNQEEFLDCCLHFGLPQSIVSELYKNVNVVIQRYHFSAIYRTLKKLAEGLAKQQITNPIAWFITTFRNEDLKVRAENHIQRVCVVS